jgi:hypothetical protein
VIGWAGKVDETGWHSTLHVEMKHFSYHPPLLSGWSPNSHFHFCPENHPAARCAACSLKSFVMEDKKQAAAQETIVAEQDKVSVGYDELSFSTNSLGRHKHFIGLVFTTLLSIILFVGQRQHWVLPVHYQVYVDKNRAPVQAYVQIISNVLGFLQATAITALVNQATRISFSRSNASLDRIKFWIHVCVQTWTWHLPSKFTLALFAILLVKWNPSVIWAGAISPVNIQRNGPLGSVLLPSYANMSLIQEYPPGFSDEGLQVRNSKGVFSYTVGITLEGELLSSASTATTIDESARNHTKLDNSGFVYEGRSYGVGASAGLTDGNATHTASTVYYQYQETGYNAQVQCIYNSSAAFVLQSKDSIITWEAKGTLPNSDGQSENSTYFGRDNGPAIVALGVASTQTPGKKYLGIAAGDDYAFLNTTQCSIEFNPTAFEVQVNITAKRIVVTPLNSASDIDPSGNLSYVATRQLELISNDQTNLFQSLLGNSFLASISSYNISQANSSAPLTESASTLAGLTNSITAMMDDILLGYGSAQLMVSNQTSPTEATVIIQPMVFGDPLFVFFVIVSNCFCLLLVVEEAIRTNFWKDLQGWDYMDIRSLIHSSSRGGTELADEIVARTWSKRSQRSVGWRSWRIWGKWRSQESLVGSTVVRLDRETGALVLAKESSSSDARFS